MNTLRSLIISSFLLCASTALNGCSWFGSSSGESDASSLSESDLAAQRERRFGAGNIPTAEGDGLFRDIHFSYDSYAIESTARNDLEANARTLADRSDLKVVLEGHTDERGTAEYNMALGAERARAIKNALVGLGIASSRLESISYGEEIPIDAGHSENSYARNRRVHFGVGTTAAPAREKSRY
jgi:peptidoglycan-associated lipoprotein